VDDRGLPECELEKASWQEPRRVLQKGERAVKRNSFSEWRRARLAADPDLARRVEELLGELRIEQDLIALRERRGLTQTQLGKLIGVSQPRIANMENGKHDFRIRTLLKAAAAMGAEMEVRLRPIKHKKNSPEGGKSPGFNEEITLPRNA